MSARELSSNARASLLDLVKPLREQLNTLDTAIAKATAELEELRKTRKSISKTLVLLDPSNAPVKPAKKETATGLTTTVAPDTLERIVKWLHAHRDEINPNGGFSAPQLAREHGFDIVSRATLTNALNQLHADGIVRLDHRGTGGAKYFKLVG